MLPDKFQKVLPGTGFMKGKGGFLPGQGGQMQMGIGHPWDDGNAFCIETEGFFCSGYGVDFFRAPDGLEGVSFHEKGLGKGPLGIACPYRCSSD
jgi:hypothetical protein